MRTRRTTIRGLIALIRKGSGKVEGVACLEDVLPPLARAHYERHFPQHRIPKRESGRSIEVVLSDEVARNVRLQLRPEMRRHLLAMPKDDREFERLTARPRDARRRR